MPILQSEALTKEKNTRRLFILIISRIVIVTLFLSITIFIDIKKQVFTISQITINFFYFIVCRNLFLFSYLYFAF